MGRMPVWAFVPGGSALAAGLFFVGLMMFWPFAERPPSGFTRGTAHAGRLMRFFRTGMSAAGSHLSGKAQKAAGAAVTFLAAGRRAGKTTGILHLDALSAGSLREMTHCRQTKFLSGGTPRLFIHGAWLLPEKCAVLRKGFLWECFGGKFSSVRRQAIFFRTAAKTFFKPFFLVGRISRMVCRRNMFSARVEAFRANCLFWPASGPVQDCPRWLKGDISSTGFPALLWRAIAWEGASTGGRYALGTGAGGALFVCKSVLAAVLAGADAADLEKSPAENENTPGAEPETKRTAAEAAAVKTRLSGEKRTARGRPERVIWRADACLQEWTSIGKTGSFWGCV